MEYNPIVQGGLTQADFDYLGLTKSDIEKSYQPSSGGTYHCRGTEDKGKTLFIAHLYRQKIDSGIFKPSDCVGNLTFKGRYGNGFTVLKGDDLHQFLWDLTHKPYRNKFVIIDEIDSEFPARFFQSKEQTEIALRMWHVRKLGNIVAYSSHLGRGGDLLFDLATHFEIIPHGVNHDGTMEFTVINGLDNEITYWTAHDLFRTMLIYNRKEMTEHTAEDSIRKRPISKRQSELVVRSGKEKLKRITEENKNAR